jgi:hypothetical protein
MLEEDTDVQATKRNRAMSRVGVTLINVSFFLFIISIICILCYVASFVIFIIGAIIILVIVMATLFVLALTGWMTRAFESLEALTEGMMVLIIVAPIAFVLSIVFFVLGWFFVGKDKHWAQAIKAKKRMKGMLIAEAVILGIVGIVVLVMQFGGGA